MKVDWNKVRVGDVVLCVNLGGAATVYHADERGVYVYSTQAREGGRGHSGSSSGVKSPIGGQCGHWNLWRDEYPEIDVIEAARKFKGNN